MEARLTWPLKNCWLGVSVEDQRTADERRPSLQALAGDGWNTVVSYEPVLGPVDWAPFVGWLSWWIAGGESGAQARQCDVQHLWNGLAVFAGSSTARFIKQVGSNPAPLRIEAGAVKERLWATGKGGDPAEWPEDLRVREWPARRQQE